MLSIITVPVAKPPCLFALLSLALLHSLLSVSCSGPSLPEDAPKPMAPNNLWADATDQYLPATAEWTNRVEVADLNGDGWPDLLFANGGNYSEPGPPEYSRVFLNEGTDAPFREVTMEVFGGRQFHARVIKVGYLNRDSFPDILLGATFQTQSQLYLGSGEAKFERVTDTHLPKLEASIGDLEFGDVDLDGDLDIALADWGPGSNMENAGGRTRLWLNDGNAHFTDVTERQMPDLLVPFSWDLEFIDFDNDFDLDLAISCKRCGTSRLFVNDGRGQFANQRLLPAYTNNYDFEVMDLNGDGYQDMVTINDGEIVGGTSWSRREHIFLNQEGKRFIDATEALWPLSENIGEDDNNISFLDYDSDGDPDFLISSLTGEDRLLINDGSARLTLAQPVLLGDPTPHTLSMVLADINRDGRLDIIMGQGEGEEVIEERIFLGQAIPPDTAPPVIANYQIKTNPEQKTVTIYARIHDHKTPNMPHDWRSVELRSGDGTGGPMSWYGEHLWQREVSAGPDQVSWQLCATDQNGNQRCIDMN